MTLSISDLIAATEQMERVALGDDWMLVERIQRRRKVLIEEIIEHARETALTEEQAQQLAAVRLQEASIAARALARREALREALGEGRKGVRTDRARRMRKAYHMNR